MSMRSRGVGGTSLAWGDGPRPCRPLNGQGRTRPPAARPLPPLRTRVPPYAGSPGAPGRAQPQLAARTPQEMEPGFIEELATRLFGKSFKTDWDDPAGASKQSGQVRRTTGPPDASRSCGQVTGGVVGEGLPGGTGGSSTSAG